MLPPSAPFPSADPRYERAAALDAAEAEAPGEHRGAVEGRAPGPGRAEREEVLPGELRQAQRAGGLHEVAADRLLRGD